MSAAQTPPIIGPGHSYASVTEKISAIVLTRRTTRGWLFGFAIGFSLLMLFLLALCYRQFRVVDRHRPRRNADLRHPAAPAPDLAHFDQPLCRGYDAVRSGLRRDFPAVAHGTPLAVLLDDSLPRHHGHLAAVPQPAGVGRFRRHHLCHGVTDVLVRGADPRPGHAARPRQEPRCASHLWSAGHGLARVGSSLAP